LTWLKSFHPDVPENNLIRPDPLPRWPEQVGFVVSLLGLSLTARLGMVAIAAVLLWSAVFWALA